MGTTLDRTYCQFRFGKWFYFIAWKWGFWFRLFGRGPHVARDRGVYFSERYGYRKVLRIGRWSFEWLLP